jgi:hypothetical protein
MNIAAFPSPRLPRSATNPRKRFDAQSLENSPSAPGYVRIAYHGLTGSPPWTKERRLAASEFADQVAKSRWLRIQYVNQVFALTLTK